MRVEDVLQAFRDGGMSLAEAAAKLKKAPFEELGFAKLDHHRELRRGFGEVVYCPGKTCQQVVEILDRKSVV